MVDYAIGDIQGCYEPLLRLLDQLKFDDRSDRLWFVGDLVNRGPQSLEVLRFIKKLPIAPHITLGNHDLHFLANLFGQSAWHNADDTLAALLEAPDKEDLGHWLRHQPLLCYDKVLNIVMCHAGIPPTWDLKTAMAAATELEHTLRADDFRLFLSNLYGNEGDKSLHELTGLPRLRFICNGLTRMRFCDALGHLALSYKGSPKNAPKNLYPWYLTPNRIPIEPDLIFGHWAALEGISLDKRIHALDTGCYWGGALTALCLQDKRRFSVSGLPH